MGARRGRYVAGVSGTDRVELLQRYGWPRVRIRPEKTLSGDLFPGVSGRRFWLSFALRGLFGGLFREQFRTLLGVLRFLSSARLRSSRY